MIPRIAFVLSLSLVLVADVAHAASYSWNVASGDWFTATNWSPPTGPPGPSDDAVIGNGGTCTLNAAAAVTNLTLSSGALTGTGTLDVSGTTDWSGGVMSGSGITNANGALTLSGAGGKEILSGRTLSSNSSATWTGTGNIVFGIGPVLSIAAATTFDVQTDADFAGNGGAAFMTINNAGTFQKSAGAGTTDVGFAVAFNNTGALDVQTGSLVLRGGGTSTGSFDATGAALTFTSSVGSETYSLSAAASITGSTFTVSGSTVNHAGSYNVATTAVTGGTVNLTGSGATLGALTVSNGVLNVSTSSASNAASLTQSNGTLGGSGTLDVSGTIDWTGGAMSGSGVTNANGPLNLSGALSKQLLSGRTLNSNSSATWTGTGLIVFGIGPVLGITAGTTFDAQTDADFSGNGGAAFMTVANAGTFQKSAGTGSTDVGFAASFSNSGIVQALTGTITFISNYTQTAGVTRQNGGAITKSSGTMSIQGGTLEGFGTLTATVNNSGGTLSPGLSAGQLNQTGAYTQGAGGAFTAEIGGLTVGTQYDRAAISGAATLGGTLTISLIGGFEPNIGDTFTIMTFGSRSGDFATVNGTTIPNGKIFQKTVNATSVVLVVVTEPTPTPSSTPTVTSTPTPTPTATATLTPTPTPIPCGNGMIDAGEQCDDGNQSGGDCCSATCQFDASGSACNDGNPCTQTDTCDGAGTCGGGNPVICLPSDGCHDPGTCDPFSGLCSNPPKPDGVACSDNDICSTGDVCQTGVCVGAGALPSGAACDDGNVCTTVDVCNGSGNCTGLGAVPGGRPCDDGQPCTTGDFCDGSGNCLVGSPMPDGASCDSGNQCAQNGVCQSGVCSGVMALADGTSCDDGDECTLADTCDVGVCIGASPAPDGVQCTDPDPCLASGTCQQGRCSGITPTENGTACDDGNDCSVEDFCQGGACISIATRPDFTPCDDGHAACTTNDQCLTGVCVGAAVADGTPCSDGDSCTQSDACFGGNCAGAAVANGTLCDDEDLCTSGDTCGGGRCTGSPTPRSCLAPIQTDAAQLAIKDKVGTAKDQLSWQWNKGAATSFADFDDPATSDDYALCVFQAGKPRPLLSARIPAGGICANGKPCWKSKPDVQYQYKDKVATPDGITALTLKASITPGKAKVSVKGQGTLLGVPRPPFLGAIRVEVRNSAPGSICWGADQTTVSKNDAANFKAKGD